MQLTTDRLRRELRVLSDVFRDRADDAEMDLANGQTPLEVMHHMGVADAWREAAAMLDERCGQWFPDADEGEPAADEMLDLAAADPARWNGGDQPR